jgi:hypothetical protein
MSINFIDLARRKRLVQFRYVIIRACAPSNLIVVHLSWVFMTESRVTVLQGELSRRVKISES